MNNSARKYLFDVDFGNGEGTTQADIDAAMSQEQIFAALEARYVEGRDAGLHEASETAAAATAKSLKAIHETLASVSQTLDREIARIESEAISMAAHLAQLYADALIKHNPEPLFEEALRKCTAMANNAPVLVISVSPDTNELIRQAISETGSINGFEGRIEICDDPNLAPGDIHITWPEGGLMKERSRLDMIVKTMMELSTGVTDFSGGEEA